MHFYRVKLLATTALGLTLWLLVVVPNCEAFLASRDVLFELHTRANHSDNFEILVADHKGITELSRFNSSKTTRIFVHGFQSDRDSFLWYAKAFLKHRDCNFIAVNWLSGAVTSNYISSRNLVVHVGTALADLIKYLVDIHGMRLADLVVVGHSLGAHIAGVAGHKLLPHRIPVIVGLDPAYPLFYKKNTASRLSIDDADYVQVIHTNGGFFGLSYPVGHADFYPNWGRTQPGCAIINSDSCSHIRAHYLYIESLSPTSSFDSVHCTSLAQIKKKLCTSSEPNVHMGGDDPDQMALARGVYYTITRRESPYALNATGEFDKVFYI